MSILRTTVALTLLMLAGARADAHEFWLEPLSSVAAGDTVPLTLMVGEFFEGVPVGLTTVQTAAIRQYSASGMRNLRDLLPLRSPVASLPLALTSAGTHMVIFDSQPSMIALPAGKFEAYLHDEGLDFIIARRLAAEASASPGRERYRRYVKTLVNASSAAGLVREAVAPASDRTYAIRSGQRLEMVPLSDPLLTPLGEAWSVRLMFEDKPLAGALLKAWHRQDDQTVMIRAKTSPDGTATFNLPFSGGWMISVVHMVPAIGVKDVDWDSLWGNLSFSVPPRRTVP